MKLTAKILLARLRAFRKDERGMASIESLLIIPLLFWAYLGTFVMFEAYKRQTDGLRVTYAVADAISREEDAINQTYLNSMRKLTNYLTRSHELVTQRVSVVCFSPKRNKYRVAWSRVSGPKKSQYPRYNNSNIKDISDDLPVMPLGDQLILVETFMEYAPLWDVGMGEMTFDYFIFTRPRFTNQIQWEGKPEWACPKA